MLNNLYWSPGMKTIQLFLLFSQVITLCDASCGPGTCNPVQKFSYKSCRDYNHCLKNPYRGGCTNKKRYELMAPHCACYLKCEESLTLVYENPKLSYCYFRGLLHTCLGKHEECKGIKSKYLKNFDKDCPCNVQHCLNGDGAYPYETSCHDHLMCLGGGPTAANAAGCSSADMVREKMIEKQLYISNPNGTWILKKDCHCVNSCPGVAFQLLPTCRRVEELISCYHLINCPIQQFKKKLVHCSCSYLCRAEIAAINALKDGTKEEICQKSLKYEACKKKFGCQEKVRSLCTGNSGNGQNHWKHSLLTIITMALLIVYSMN